MHKINFFSSKSEPVFFRNLPKVTPDDAKVNANISGTIRSCARFLIFLETQNIGDLSEIGHIGRSAGQNRPIVYFVPLEAKI